MTRNKEDFKKTRKELDKTRRFMRDQGLLNNEPPFRLIQHPRAYNKPMSCQLGKHDWTVEVHYGVPFMVCKKCWAMIAKGIFEGTETKEETRTRHIKQPEPPLTIERMIENYFNAVDEKEMGKR